MIHFCRDPGSDFLVSWSCSLSSSQETGHHFAIQRVFQAYDTGFVDAGMLKQTVFNLDR